MPLQLALDCPKLSSVRGNCHPHLVDVYVRIHTSKPLITAVLLIDADLVANTCILIKLISHYYNAALIEERVTSNTLSNTGKILMKILNVYHACFKILMLNS